ncbi:MAG: Asp-tRNA(Asn)/Glu-tRNA(Gln) amidotransferase subunit GatC [Acidimicrobiales bacterium]
MTDGPTHSLSRDDVAEVASLALLDLSDAELDTFTGQLAAVLEHAKDIDALDVHDVPPTAHPYPLVNVFRDDVVSTTDDERAATTDAVLATAPDAEAHQFRVPPALGEEP